MSSLGFSQNIVGWILDRKVDPKTTIQQGDLIKFESSPDVLKNVGIVVTADCDLVNKKHARLVTLIPVVSAKVVIEHYLIMEDCERKRDDIEKFVFDNYSINQNQERQTNLSLLRQKMSECLVDSNNIVLAAAEFVLDKLEFMPIESYKNLMSAIKKSPQKSDSLKDKIKSRGDLLILPDTSQLGVVGEVAWMRHIWQTPLNSIAIRTSETSERLGERIARLDSPYRYRLTQLMAQVFSDIGLPETPNQIDRIVNDTYANG